MPDVLLIVEPISSGTELITAAHDLGFEVAVASYDRDDRTLPGAVRERVDHLLVVDTNDEEALFAAVTDFHGRRPLAGAVPGFEFYVGTTARLAHRLGLPGLPVAQVEGLRDKAVMRADLARAGLRVPRHVVARDAEELAAAAAVVGFPAVLKPTGAAGSVHVTRVEDTGELRRAYQWLREDTRLDTGRGLDGPVLLEEYVPGPEISVEGYVVDGEVTVVAVTTKLLGPEPHFVEIGMVVQHDLEPSVRLAVEEYTADIVRSLGLTLGPFHCELRLPEGRPVLIEVGARLAGHRIPYLVELVTGVSLPRIMVGAYTGLSPEKANAFGAPRTKYAAIHCFVADKGQDVFHGVRGLGALEAADDVLEVALYYTPGSEIPPAEDFRALLGHVVLRAESYAGALARIAELEDGAPVE